MPVHTTTPQVDTILFHTQALDNTDANKQGCNERVHQYSLHASDRTLLYATFSRLAYLTESYINAIPIERPPERTVSQLPEHFVIDHHIAPQFLACAR